jgi:TonB family protein
MSTRLRSAGLTLLLCFSTVAALPYNAMAQDSTQQQETKRKIKKRVEPTYPDIAKRLNLTGKVKVQVVISPEGRVTSTKEIGGNPVLLNAAEQAVKGWSFEAGPNETTEIVEFNFTGDSN